MKVILDTNVFISGIFFSGPPHQILKAWRDKKIQIVISPEILDEYQRVGGSLATKYPGIEIHPFIELLTARAELISSKNFHVYICEDPDDDKFFACAIASRTKLIISGDKHLLNVSGYQGIKVIRPRQFIDEYF